MSSLLQNCMYRQAGLALQSDMLSLHRVSNVNLQALALKCMRAPQTGEPAYSPSLILELFCLPCACLVPSR